MSWTQATSATTTDHPTVAVVYHTDAFLHKHDKSRIIFDQTDPMPVPSTMCKAGCSSFYTEELEEECARESTEYMRSLTRIMPVTWRPDNLTAIPCYLFITHRLYGLADNRVRWNHHLLAAGLSYFDQLMKRLSPCALRCVCLASLSIVPLRYLVTTKAS